MVFNPLSWTRTDVLRVELPQGLSDRRARLVVLPRRTARRAGQGRSRLRLRVLKLQRRPKPPGRRAGRGQRIESRFYRVEFDPASGGIVSIRDKELDRELVDRKAPFRLNQYVYVGRR